MSENCNHKWVPSVWDSVNYSRGIATTFLAEIFCSGCLEMMNFKTIRAIPCPSAWNKVDPTFLETYPKKSGHYLIFSMYTTPMMMVASFDAATVKWSADIPGVPEFSVDYWMELPLLPENWDKRKI